MSTKGLQLVITFSLSALLTAPAFASSDGNRVVRCRQQALVDKALAAVLFLESKVGREHANALLVQRPNQRNEVAVAGD